MIKYNSEDLTIFGTCRNKIPSNGLNTLIHYPHTTKEIIQMINFIKNKQHFESPYNMYCFQTPSVNKDKFFSNNHIFYDKFINSKYCIVEISSKKHFAVIIII